MLEEPKVVWERAVNFNSDFRIHNLNNASLIPKGVICRCWTRPSADVFKMNFDVAWTEHMAGCGIILHGQDGFVHRGRWFFHENVMTSP